MPLKDAAKELLARGDGLFTKRFPLLTLWQQCCENFHVMRADYTRKRHFSEEFGSYLMTGRPGLAHRDLTNSLPALMRPRDRQWLWARTPDERINEDSEARGYLDWMSRQQYRAMYDLRAGMVRSLKEADGDYTSVGNAVISVEANQDRDGLQIRCWHPRDVVWTEGMDLKINQVHHKLKMPMRDICKRWPGMVSEKFKTDCAKTPDAEINVRRIVAPVDEYDLPVKNKARIKYVSIWIDVDNQTLLEETPSARIIYVIPRWVTISGSQYAYSPAVIMGMPDARMLQRIALTMLEAAEKATDPPLKAAAEAISGGVNSGAGMITWVDSDYDERTGPALEHLLPDAHGVQYGAAREERVEGNLDATFFLNQLRMPQVTKDMTAYEASKLYEEFQRNSLPLLEPIEVDYNGNFCTEVFNVCQSIGTFGSPNDVPKILQDQDLRWEFDTPLKAAAEQAKVFAFSNVTDTVVKGMQVDETIKMNVDWNKATREAITGVGGADWLLPVKQVAALQAQHAQQQQAAQAADQMAHGADAATGMATAVKSAAEARDAMGAV